MRPMISHPFTSISTVIALSGPPVDIGQQETSPTNTCQHQYNECSPFLPPEVFQRLQNVELENTTQKYGFAFI